MTAPPAHPPRPSHAAKPPARGYCLCCRRENVALSGRNAKVCSVCIHHQNDDSGGWTKRDVHHRQLWASQLDGATNAYLDELITLEREMIRLKGILKVAGISSVPLDPNAPARARIHELRAQFISDPQTIGSILTDDGFKPPQGNRWTCRMVNELAGRSATATRAGAGR
jgi:hypothetical protein